MLSPARLQRKWSSGYVCWRCYSRFHDARSNNGIRELNTTFQSFFSNPRKPKALPRRPLFSKRSATSVTVAAQPLSSSQQPHPPIKPIDIDIRERLRIWEVENVAATPGRAVAPGEFIRQGDVVNSLTRLQSGEFQVESDGDGIGEEEGIASTTSFGRDGLLDVGSSRTFLFPGDLVELTSRGTRQQELAIYVRSLEKQSQFYTMTGRFVHRLAAKSKFYIQNFVKPDELEDILPHLPQTDVSPELEDRMQSMPAVVPRHIGKPLVQKMIAFWNTSESAYQSVASQLDNAHKQVAHTNLRRYATLEEIAGEILPSERKDNRKFSQPLLYAVHQSIMRDEVGFRPHNHSTPRLGAQYEISSHQEVNNIHRVTVQVRQYRDDILKKGAKSTLHGFIRRARRLVDMSRERREFTSHGTLGLSSEVSGNNDYRSGTLVESFGQQDVEFIDFMESWASMSNFGPLSVWNGIGSTILRAIGRYQQVPLDRQLAWTFLQEVGILPPWQTQAAFVLRMPGTGKALDHQLMLKDDEFISDKLSLIRKDWGDLTVFCVDDPGALEVDDGISLQPTDTKDEYWVHIHVADPAAHIDPKSGTAAAAERSIQTIYLPDRVVTMLESDFVRSKLSLARGRPCLTFSARMNLDGDLLETMIKPAIVQNVIYMTHDLADEIAGFKHPKSTFYAVGKVADESQPSRHLAELHELSQKQIDELQILSKLAKARGKLLEAKGGMNSGMLLPSTSVSFHGNPWKQQLRDKSFRYDGDPSITLGVPNYDPEDLWKSTDKINLIGRCMLIAGEIAAQWCTARGIPIIFRVTPLNEGRQDPVEFYHTKVLPLLAESEDGRVPFDIVREYLIQIGQTQPSTIAGPHLAVGVDMISKVTSPLRRYGDLLSQWQIEGALLEEARLGHSLAGNTRDDFLPFTRAGLDALLPRLDIQERTILKFQRSAERQWHCAFLLRAWRFKQLEFPRTLDFVVRSMNPTMRSFGGFLSKYLIGVQANTIPEWLKFDEVKIGDRFEVDIEDVSVFTSVIDVKLIRRLSATESVH